MSKRYRNYSGIDAPNDCASRKQKIRRITSDSPRRFAGLCGGLNAALIGCALVSAGGSMVAMAAQPVIETSPQFYQDPLDVKNRPRPDYDPEGIPVGSFLLYPSLEVGEYYDSNIYATETNEESDFVTTYAPSISLVSDWNNHAVGFNAYAAGGIYKDHSDENFFDYGVSAGGRLDVRRSTSVFGTTSYDHLHEDRGSPEDVNGNEPSEYDQFIVGLGGGTRQGSFSVRVDGNFTRLIFQDVQDNNGLLINNQDRNQDIWDGAFRLGYQFKSDYEIFFRGAYSEVVYDNNPDDNGVNRDNNGWRADVGLAANITDTLVFDIYGGYLQRYYESSTFQDTGDYDVGGDLFWSITPLTSARATVFRSFDETTQTGASSILQTTGELEVSHELLRNVILSANARLTDYDYQGITRNDDVWSLGVDGRYLINRNFYVGGGADYRNRDSNFAGESYDEVQIGAFVGVRM